MPASGCRKLSDCAAEPKLTPNSVVDFVDCRRRTANDSSEYSRPRAAVAANATSKARWASSSAAIGSPLPVAAGQMLASLGDLPVSRFADGKPQRLPACDLIAQPIQRSRASSTVK